MRNNTALNIYYIIAAVCMAYLLGSFFATPQMEGAYHLSRFFGYLILTQIGIYLFLLIPAVILIVSVVRVKKHPGRFYQSLDLYIGAVAGALFVLAIVMVYAFVSLH